MITVLLAACNGGRYIKQQLDSLFAQTVQDFRVCVCDDASKDATVSIIEAYREKYPGRISLTRRKKNSGSPKKPFFTLMRENTDGYCMLCDQDDVWNPDKIELSLKKIKELEAAYGASAPLLVFTDLTVTDEDLNITAPSFKRVMASDYTQTGFNTLLVQNVLTGCTAMYNGALAKLIREPDYCVMHDWWLILAAAAFGHIGVIDAPTVLYRQHGRNQIGAKRVVSAGYKIRKLIRYREIKTALDETYAQAAAFFETYADLLTPAQQEMLADYAEIPGKPKLERWYTVRRHGIMKIGKARRIAHFLFI